jgi:hypothetical protein
MWDDVSRTLYDMYDIAMLLALQVGGLDFHTESYKASEVWSGCLLAYLILLNTTTVSPIPLHRPSSPVLSVSIADVRYRGRGRATDNCLGK